MLIPPLYSLLLLTVFEDWGSDTNTGTHFCITTPCHPSYRITFFVKSILIVYYYEYTYIPFPAKQYTWLCFISFITSFFLKLLISFCFHLLYVCIVNIFQILQTPINKFSKHLNVSQFFNPPLPLTPPFFPRKLPSAIFHPSAPVFLFLLVPLWAWCMGVCSSYTLSVTILVFSSGPYPCILQHLSLVSIESFRGSVGYISSSHQCAHSIALMSSLHPFC